MRDLLFEAHDGVATISINRPHARNALAHQTMAELDEAIATLSGDVRVLVLRGSGDKAFCAGGDLKELEHMRGAADAAAMAHRMRATRWEAERSSPSRAISGSQRPTPDSDSLRSASV